MYVSLYLDNEFYSGEVIPYHEQFFCRYRVDMGEQIKFTIYMGDEGQWIASDRINKDLVRSVGAEIERRDIHFKDEVLSIVHYSSNPLF